MNTIKVVTDVVISEFPSHLLSVDFVEYGFCEEEELHSMSPSVGKRTTRRPIVLRESSKEDVYICWSPTIDQYFVQPLHALQDKVESLQLSEAVLRKLADAAVSDSTDLRNRVLQARKSLSGRLKFLFFGEV